MRLTFKLLAHRYCSCCYAHGTAASVFCLDMSDWQHGSLVIVFGVLIAFDCFDVAIAFFEAVCYPGIEKQAYNLQFSITLTI